MKIYVSASFSQQQTLRPMAEALRQKGHEIISSWLHETTKPDYLGKQDWERRLAAKDIAEVFASDCIILDTNEASTTGGMHVEWGVASHPQSMITRIVVGPVSSIFQRLADKHYDSWDALLADMGAA